MHPAAESPDGQAGLGSGSDSTSAALTTTSIPAVLASLEQLARHELARWQATLPPPSTCRAEDMILLALAWDLGLSGNELARG